MVYFAYILFQFLYDSHNPLFSLFLSRTSLILTCSHIGIAKAFVHKAYRESRVPVELISKLKGSYDKLYALRRKADYTDELITERVTPELEEYINSLQEALGYVS